MKKEPSERQRDPQPQQLWRFVEDGNLTIRIRKMGSEVVEFEIPPLRAIYSISRDEFDVWIAAAELVVSEPPDLTPGVQWTLSGETWAAHRPHPKRPQRQIFDYIRWSDSAGQWVNMRGLELGTDIEKAKAKIEGLLESEAGVQNAKRS